MRISAKLVGLVGVLTLLVAAPIVSAYDSGGSRDGRGGDNRSCGDSRSGSYGGGSYGGSYGGGGGDLDVFGLTADARLVCFRSDRPGDARDVGRISGLTGDTRLVGIDYRPASGNDGDNGDLYGLGNAGGVYTINTRTAQATKRSQMNTALNGTSFGVDFNPAVDRLRVISDTGQNLRVNVDDGTTTTDTPLSYPPSPPPATGVTGAAYTNNDSDANTATTLYDLDSMMDQTAIQSPANSGQLAATGKLGVDTNSTIGFDIYSTVRNGSTVDVDGFASLTVGGQSRFYEITLFNGRAQSRGAFASRNQVTAVAIPLNQL